MEKKILLVDGNSLMYKAFYASSIFLKKGIGYDKRGKPINALRTFSSMILNLLDKYNSPHALIAFDEKGLKTYRSEFSFYKANRKKMPDELISQKILIEEILDLAGIKKISSINLEADDIIGSIAKKYSKRNIKVDIVTSDKDLLQLVDENITVFISKTGVSDMVEYNHFNFKDIFFGLEPWQIVELKGIMGDKSDNLDGIKGIGEKTAIKLLNEFGSLDEVLNNYQNFSPSIRNKIEKGKDMSLNCRSIAKIITDDDIDIEFEKTKVGPIDRKGIISFLKEHSIYNLANKLEERWF